MENITVNKDLALIIAMLLRDYAERDNLPGIYMDTLHDVINELEEVIASQKEVIK